MKNRKNVRVRRKAFTLIEVLLVLVILGIIAVLVLTQLGGAGEQANKKAAEVAIKGQLGSAIERYKLSMKRYPREDDGGLRALLEKPSDDEAAKDWAGPYIAEEALKDPWGKEYIYQFPGRFNEQGFDLSSAGPDGQEGTDDDVKNWKQS